MLVCTYVFTLCGLYKIIFIKYLHTLLNYAYICTYILHVRTYLHTFIQTVLPAIEQIILKLHNVCNYLVIS